MHEASIRLRKQSCSLAQQNHSHRLFLIPMTTRRLPGFCRQVASLGNMTTRLSLQTRLPLSTHVFSQCQPCQLAHPALQRFLPSHAAVTSNTNKPPNLPISLSRTSIPPPITRPPFTPATFDPHISHQSPLKLMQRPSPLSSHVYSTTLSLTRPSLLPIRTSRRRPPSTPSHRHLDTRPIAYTAPAPLPHPSPPANSIYGDYNGYLRPPTSLETPRLPELPKSSIRAATSQNGLERPCKPFTRRTMSPSRAQHRVNPRFLNVNASERVSKSQPRAQT